MLPWIAVFPEFLALSGDFALADAGAGHRCARVLTRSLRCAAGCGLRARPFAGPGTSAAVHRATNSGKTAAAITGAAAMPSDNPSTKGSESWNPGSLERNHIMAYEVTTSEHNDTTTDAVIEVHGKLLSTDSGEARSLPLNRLHL